MPLIIVAVGACFLPVVGLGLWLAGLAVAGGDRPGDATTRIVVDARGDGWLTVRNPSGVPVPVGAMTRSRHPLAWIFQPPDLVVRPARRSERSGGRDWAAAMLGVVPPGSEMRWPVPDRRVPARLLVTLWQPGARLRVHDHLLAPVSLPH
jgi:hypothetical protein